MKDNLENIDMSNDFIDVEEKRNNNYMIVIVLYIIVIILFILLIFGLKHQKDTIVDNNLNNTNNQNLPSNNSSNYKDTEDSILDFDEENVDGNIKETKPNINTSVFDNESSILNILE